MMVIILKNQKIVLYLNFCKNIELLIKFNNVLFINEHKTQNEQRKLM